MLHGLIVMYCEEDNNVQKVIFIKTFSNNCCNMEDNSVSTPLVFYIIQ